MHLDTESGKPAIVGVDKFYTRHLHSLDFKCRFWHGGQGDSGKRKVDGEGRHEASKGCSKGCMGYKDALRHVEFC